MSDYRVDTLRLAWLQAFITVVEKRSFTRAAKELRWNQSTVSRYIKDLSIWLDKPLFDPPKTPYLTPAGEEFYETAKKVLAILQEARSEEAAEKTTASYKRQGKIVRAVIAGTGVVLAVNVIKAIAKGRAIGVDFDPKKQGLTFSEREVRKAKPEVPAVSQEVASEEKPSGKSFKLFGFRSKS